MSTRSFRAPVICCCLLLVAGWLAGQAPAAAQEAPQKTVTEVRQLVQAYCGGCHKVPPPGVMPKKDWPRSVRIMADLAAEKAGQTVMDESVIRDITAFYYGSAPERLPRLPVHADPEPAAFSKAETVSQSELPVVIDVNAVSLRGDDRLQFLVCDGENDRVTLLERADEQWNETTLAEIEVPASTRVVDFDGDGDQDILVAALGFLAPSEALTGEIWLLRQKDDGEFESERLLDELGRVTDVNVADLDSDGDQDLVLAIFGGGDVGSVSWIENRGRESWKMHDIISASGSLNVGITDLNDDGRPDIVTLIAQQYEMVLGLINDGQGGFRQEALGGAPHPMFGSTALRLVDIDSDILFANGDSQDLQRDPKPYHGVQWLENQGQLQFAFHDIGRFYGTAVAEAVDLDGDGDMDIVAGSWNNYWDEVGRQSMIWFENDGEEHFRRRNLLAEPTHIVTFAFTDIDADGLPDILAGVLQLERLIERMRGAQGGDSAPQDESASEDQSPSRTPRLVLLKNRLPAPD